LFVVCAVRDVCRTRGVVGDKGEGAEEEEEAAAAAAAAEEEEEEGGGEQINDVKTESKTTSSKTTSFSVNQ